MVEEAEMMHKCVRLFRSFDVCFGRIAHVKQECNFLVFNFAMDDLRLLLAKKLNKSFIPSFLKANLMTIVQIISTRFHIVNRNFSKCSANVFNPFQMPFHIHSFFCYYMFSLGCMIADMKQRIFFS
jgi:hypothetical protein